MTSPCCGASRPSSVSKLKPRTRMRRKKKKAAAQKDKNMALISGGRFAMGTADSLGFAEDGEGPVREVELDPFYIDACAVTNAQFARFVRATGYKTESELFGWSFVFHLFVSPQNAAHIQQTVVDTPWWWALEGACWSCPEGPGSTIKNRLNHPAIHISWNDAVAYCEWADTRLPTEAEWEYSARGGLSGKTYPWGDELTPEGKHLCNIWQGTFPENNTVEDGFRGTAPVRSFPPNRHGLYNISGNVWEWCSDWFSPDYHLKGPRTNPAGPPEGQARVMRGGSIRIATAIESLPGAPTPRTVQPEISASAAPGMPEGFQEEAVSGSRFQVYQPETRNIISKKRAKNSVLRPFLVHPSNYSLTTHTFTVTSTSGCKRIGTS